MWIQLAGFYLKVLKYTCGTNMCLGWFNHEWTALSTGVNTPKTAPITSLRTHSRRSGSRSFSSVYAMCLGPRWRAVHCVWAAGVCEHTICFNWFYHQTLPFKVQYVTFKSIYWHTWNIIFLIFIFFFFLCKRTSTSVCSPVSNPCYPDSWQ